MKFLALTLSLMLSLSAYAQTAELNYTRLVETLEETQPKTVADALRELKIKYPSYFESYALVSRSMSIQGGDLKNPRVVLFNQDAKLVVTFNGEAGQRGYDRLEVMALDEATGIYDMREINFPQEKGLPGTFEISESGGAGGRCLNCHGNNGAPIFDSYPFWPDAFGSMAKTNESLISTVQKNEVATYAAFVASAETNERYKNLAGLSFSGLTEMNSRLSRAFSKVVSKLAKADLNTQPELKVKFKTVFDAFNASEHFNQSSQGPAFPKAHLSVAAKEELAKLSDYHATKLTRYARNYMFDKNILLDQLMAPNLTSSADIAVATGIDPENKLHLWTYSQSQPADLLLLPMLRDALGQEVMYLNSWSFIPGGRFIDFAHPDLAPAESGIESALLSLL